MEEEQKGEVFQSPPQYESRLSRPKPQGPARKIFIIVSAILVLGILIFGVTRFFGGSENKQSNLTPTPTEALPTDTPIPTDADTTPIKKPTDTPTPKPTVNPVDKETGLDRSKLSIHVKNGSGTAGASKKASDYLESLGYNVIQVGNADNFDYQKTTIQVKSSKENFLSLLKKDLSANYSVGTTSADLASSETVDAIVIVGKE